MNFGSTLEFVHHSLHHLPHVHATSWTSWGLILLPNSFLWRFFHLFHFFYFFVLEIFRPVVTGFSGLFSSLSFFCVTSKIHTCSVQGTSWFLPCFSTLPLYKKWCIFVQRVILVLHHNHLALPSKSFTEWKKKRELSGVNTLHSSRRWDDDDGSRYGKREWKASRTRKEIQVQYSSLKKKKKLGP